MKDKDSGAWVFVSWCSLFLILINAGVGATYALTLPKEASLTGPTLNYLLLSAALVLILFAGLPTFFFKKSHFLYAFTGSCAAVLCVSATSYGTEDLQQAKFWGPWLVLNAGFNWALWKLHVKRNLRTGTGPTPEEPYGGVYYDHFISPVRIERGERNTRIYFASNKDGNWITNGMVVTVSDAQEITEVTFHSREFGVALWSRRGSETLRWENAPEGRRKWRSAFAESGAEANLDRQVVIDVLRLIENSTLRQAIDECLSGTPTMWDPSFQAITRSQPLDTKTPR